MARKPSDNDDVGSAEGWRDVERRQAIGNPSAAEVTSPHWRVRVEIEILRFRQSYFNILLVVFAVAAVALVLIVRFVNGATGPASASQSPPPSFMLQPGVSDGSSLSARTPAPALGSPTASAGESRKRSDPLRPRPGHGGYVVVDVTVSSRSLPAIALDAIAPDGVRRLVADLDRSYRAISGILVATEMPCTWSAPDEATSPIEVGPDSPVPVTISASDDGLIRLEVRGGRPDALASCALAEPRLVRETGATGSPSSAQADNQASGGTSERPGPVTIDPAGPTESCDPPLLGVIGSPCDRTPSKRD